MTTLVPTQNTDSQDLDAILRTLADTKITKAPESVSKLPTTVQVTPAQIQAVRSLYGILETTEVPSERRTLTGFEHKNLMDLVTTAKAARSAAERAEEAVRTAVFNHFDVELESMPGVSRDDLPRDVKGFYQVAGELEVDGLGKRFVRELAQAAPEITARDFKELRDAGLISRAEYYTVTRKADVPRVVDEDGLLAKLKDPKFAKIVSEVIRPGKVTNRFFVRDIKKED